VPAARAARKAGPDLPLDVDLSHDAGLQPGGDPQEVLERGRAHPLLCDGAHGRRRDARLPGQHLDQSGRVHRGAGVDLAAAAGGENEGFRRTQRRDLGQEARDGVSAHGQSFEQIQGSLAVRDPHLHQLFHRDRHRRPTPHSAPRILARGA